jgi:hypothetical protein
VTSCLVGQRAASLAGFSLRCLPVAFAYARHGSLMGLPKRFRHGKASFSCQRLPRIPVLVARPTLLKSGFAQQTRWVSTSGANFTRISPKTTGLNFPMMWQRLQPRSDQGCRRARPNQGQGPSGGREDAASLDRPCARRLEDSAVGPARFLMSRPGGIVCRERGEFHRSHIVAPVFVGVFFRIETAHA